MRTIISIIVLAAIIGGVFGYIAGHRLSDEYPYSLEQEKAALAKEPPEAESSDDNRQDTAPPSDNENKSHPVIAIDEETHDFGVFEKEQKGEHTFVVRNEGNANLSLKVLNKSCSCTSVDLSRATVPPGRDAHITIHWEPNTSGGSYQQGVEIGTNDPARLRFQLAVRGVYSAPVIASPTPLQLNAFSSETATNHTRVYYFGKDAVTVHGIVSDDPHFSATFAKSELTEENLKNNYLKLAKSVYDVTVTMKPGMQIGHFKQNLTVRSDSELDPEFTLPVTGQVLGDLAISSRDYDQKTGVLNMGTTYLGTAVQKSLMIRFKTSGETKPEFKIASTSPEWLKANLGQIISGEGDRSLLQVTIGIPADARLGTSDMSDDENSAAVVIESNIPEISTIRIPVKFDVRERIAE